MEGESTCCICYCDDIKSKGLQLCDDHWLCSDCSQGYITDLMNNLDTQIPPKWSFCKKEFDASILEDLMTEKQIEFYSLYQLMRDMKGTNQKLVKCPDCNMPEIWDDDTLSNFFYCKNEACGKVSCAICFKNVQKSKDNEMTPEMEAHLKCNNAEELFNAWEKVLEQGMSRSCPSCGHTGLKNEMCCHIVCQKWQTHWWYFCRAAGIIKFGDGSHYANWETDPSKCPIWLSIVHAKDNRWPSTKNDDDCKAFFHKLIVYKAIQDFFKIYDRATFDKMCAVFPAANDHCHNIDEALSADTTLIKR